jgi:hypothetical protein
MPKPVYEEGDVTVLWNQTVHTDREVTANRPDITIKNKIHMCARIYVPESIMCRHFVYVATPGRLALATVLRLVDCNVTHDVTLLWLGSPSKRNIRR